MNRQSVFRTTGGRETIRAYYNGILDMLPLHCKTLTTSFGQTFVLEAGDPHNPPVILLHGSCSNSAAWLGDMPALASQYRVLAVDIPGEPGNSEEYRLDFQTGAHLRWLHETLDALGLEKAAIAGNSMGGWLALQYAAAYPERVTALALIAASGILEPRDTFMRQIAGIGYQPDTMHAVNDAMTTDAALPKEVLEFMALIAEHFLPYDQALPVLTDAQMRRLDMPVIYLAGTGDITMDVHQATERLSALVPHAQIRLLEGAHIITTASQQLIPFLRQHIAAPAT